LQCTTRTVNINTSGLTATTAAETQTQGRTNTTCTSHKSVTKLLQLTSNHKVKTELLRHESHTESDMASYENHTQYKDYKREDILAENNDRNSTGHIAMAVRSWNVEETSSREAEISHRRKGCHTSHKYHHIMTDTDRYLANCRLSSMQPRCTTSI